MGDLYDEHGFVEITKFNISREETFSYVYQVSNTGSFDSSSDPGGTDGGF